MQTIARANRVYPGKHSGLIVDYANVFGSLEKALAIYGAGAGGEMPVKDKSQLVAELELALIDAEAFCQGHGVSLDAVVSAQAGSLQRLQLVGAAVEALISPDPLRKGFFFHAKLVKTLYDALKPDLAILEFVEKAAALGAIDGAIRSKLNPTPADISAVMADIGALLDLSITSVNMPEKPPPAINLSQLDTAALQDKLKMSKQKNIDVEVIKAGIRKRLQGLLAVNKLRADFLEKFEALIEAYNNGSCNIELLLKELMVLSQSLSYEEERHVRENLTEEELVIFDILTRPAPELTPAERDGVKKVARELLEKVKAGLVINWRGKSSARSKVRMVIEDVLDVGLPRPYDELFKDKCSAIFEHFYEKYPDQSAGVVGGNVGI